MRPVDSAADITRVPDEIDDRQPAADDHKLVDRRDTGRPPDNLRQRLDRLPAGHPSSPYDADGSPRHPTPRLRDLDTTTVEEVLTQSDSGPTCTDNSDSTSQGTNDSYRRVDPDPQVDHKLPGHDSTAEAEPVTNTKPMSDAHQPSDTESLVGKMRPADHIRLVTDAEWAEHKADVRVRLREAQRAGLSTAELYTIDRANKIWSDERDLIHDSIIDDVYKESDNVPCDGKAIMAGGLGGAGKSTVLSNRAGIDLSQYLTINPDNIKEEMARRGLVPEVEGLTPMEASDLVHEESSHIAKRIARRAEADGKNIIWDFTMSSHESTEQRIGNLRSAGYAVDGIFIDIPVETSIRRADSRHREGYNDYRAGVGLGGRYVPREVTEAQADPDWGSKNRKVFEDIRHLFDRWIRYDNSVDGRPALMVESSPPNDKNPERGAG